LLADDATPEESDHDLRATGTTTAGDPSGRRDPDHARRWPSKFWHDQAKKGCNL
jgi:hypothetical protein